MRSTGSLFVRLTSWLAILLSASAYDKVDVFRNLGRQLSYGASISEGEPLPRWSEYHAPKPGIIVGVKCEEDVAVTVRYCLAHNITFVVQNGGNGWSTTFTCRENSIAIDLQALKTIDISPDKTSVTIGGGVLVRDLIDVAYENDLQVLTGNCNCNGVLGVNLGGGYSRLMGKYGFGVDNFISMNVITAKGEHVKVNQSNSDMWFAMRGAGPNFGIVTSATLKAYQVPKARNGAWTGPLIFPEHKLERIIKAMDALDKDSRMSLFVYFAARPPTFEPTIIVIPFYLNGDSETGKQAFESILKIGPLMDQVSWTPYNKINAASEDFCLKGGQKPTYGVGLSKPDPATWVTIWRHFKQLIKNPEFRSSTILLEGYPLQEPVLYGDDTSCYPFRSTIKYNVAITVAYNDTSFAAEAKAFGQKIRDLARSSSGLSRNETYINYAYGDEPLETIYGSNLERLRQLKGEYDPKNRFGQWFPLL